MSGAEVRRLHSAAEVEALCAPDELLGVLVSSPMGEVDARRRSRCWAIGEPGHELAVVTATTIGPGAVTASVLLHDRAAAPTVARLLTTARAARLVGAAGHVRPVADLFAGAKATELELLAASSGNGIPAHRDGGRIALVDDVPALVELYGRFELEALPSAALEGAIAGLVGQRRVVVAEVDGAIVAAQRVEARSRRWDLWGGLTVRPEHRRTGVSRVVDRSAAALTFVAGRGAAGIRAPGNLVPHRRDGLVSHPWVEVRLPVAATLPARARRWARRQVRTRGRGGRR